MPKAPLRNLSLSLVYANTTNEMFILLIDAKGRNIRVPLALWRSAHIRLCLLRKEPETSGNVCTALGKTSGVVKCTQALHIAYSDTMLWLTLHVVNGRRHSKKSVEFERCDIVQLLTVSRHAILEAASTNAKQRKLERENNDAQTSTD